MRAAGSGAHGTRGARSRGRRLPALLAVASLALGACATGSESSSGSEAAAEGVTRTLRMAHIDAGPGLDPPVGWFVEAVESASSGALAIEVIWPCCGAEADVEEELVADVAAGKFDLGWVGTRVFAGLGVHDLSALTAPMLVDSYALQQAVLTEGIADAMLAALDPLGVDGMAVLPGLLRRPISRERPLRSQADWQGLTIHTFHAVDHARAIEALGATPTDVGFAARDAGLEDGSIDGMENSVALHFRRVDPQRYLTLNVPLWARVSVLLANPGVATDLRETELGWLREAAADVVARTGELADRDAGMVQVACDGGGRYALASDEELAELREALASVQAELERDTATRAALQRIRDLSEKTAAEDLPEIPEGCGAETDVAAGGNHGRAGAPLPDTLSAAFTDGGHGRGSV